MNSGDYTGTEIRQHKSMLLLLCLSQREMVIYFVSCLGGHSVFFSFVKDIVRGTGSQH